MYFFVSNKKFDNGTILNPRIPQNRLTIKGTEDFLTPRVCICKSIIGALNSTEIYDKHKTIYVYTCNPNSVITPTEKQVSDCIFTGEEWSLEPVVLNLFTILYVSKETLSDNIIEWKFKDKKSIGFYNFKLYQRVY